MKANEFRQLTRQDLVARLDELAEEQFNLRFQGVSGHLASSVRVREVRRDIARVHTVLREHDLGLKTLATGENENA